MSNTKMRTLQVFRYVGDNDTINDLDIEILNTHMEYRDKGLNIECIVVASEPIEPNPHDHLIEAVESIIEYTKKGGGLTTEMREELEDELKRLKGEPIG